MIVLPRPAAIRRPIRPLHRAALLRALPLAALALLACHRLGETRTGAAAGEARVDSTWVASRLGRLAGRDTAGRVAFRELVEHGAEALPYLAQALRQGPDALREPAATVLAHVGKPGVDVLLPAVRDSTRRESFAARLGLESSDDPAALEGAASLLSDPDPAVRIRAVGVLRSEAMAGSEESRVAVLLRPALHDSAAAVRAEAANAVGQSRPRDPVIVGELAALLHDPDADVRSSAAMGLVYGGRRSRPAVTALAQALRSAPEDETRLRAAQALGEIGDTAAVPALLDGSRDRAANVRAMAVRGLGEVGLPHGPDAQRVLDLLTPLALRGKAGVAQEAAGALAQLDDRATPSLLRVLAEGNDSTAAISAMALGFHSPSPAVAGALYRAIESRGGDVRDAAADALVGFGSAQLPRLRTLAAAGGASAAAAARALRDLEQALSVPVAERCYTLRRGPWTPAMELGEDSVFSTPPATVRFTTHPEHRRNQVSFLAESLKQGETGLYMGGSWSVVPADSVTIVWSNGFSGVTAKLRALPDGSLRGTASTFWDFPREQQTAPITGVAIQCGDAEPQG